MNNNDHANNNIILIMLIILITTNDSPSLETPGAETGRGGGGSAGAWSSCAAAEWSPSWQPTSAIVINSNSN